MYNFSVVIPHKNTPELLVRLLDSIPQRDDLEIIIVDDNSNPYVVDFNRFPGIGRQNTTIIYDKSGRGAGAARNIALDIARGYWLIFADADDYFSENFNRILDRYCEVRDLHMVVFNAMSIDEKDNRYPLALTRYIDNYFKGTYRALDVLRFHVWSPWSKMVSREVFLAHNIRFEEVPTGNDVMAMLQSSIYSNKIAVEKGIVYLYYKPIGGSQTDKAYDYNAYVLRLRQRFEINRIYKSAKYPFLWPICRCFNNKQWNSTEEVKRIMRDNNYNKIKDLFILIKYILIKMLNYI